jgi:hypothetical protein
MMLKEPCSLEKMAFVTGTNVSLPIRLESGI